MNKKIIITILLALVWVAGQAKVKNIVWEQPLKAYTVDPSLKFKRLN